jgi:hypothetical protein
MNFMSGSHFALVCSRHRRLRWHGTADILWRNLQTGQVGIWLNITTGGNVGSEAIVNPPGDLNWNIVGTGDFNGDGKADILWQNANTGALSIWFMNGTQIISEAGIGTANAGWTIVGTADSTATACPIFSGAAPTTKSVSG